MRKNCVSFQWECFFHESGKLRRRESFELFSRKSYFNQMQVQRDQGFANNKRIRSECSMRRTSSDWRVDCKLVKRKGILNCIVTTFRLGLRERLQEPPRDKIQREDREYSFPFLRRVSSWLNSLSQRPLIDSSCVCREKDPWNGVNE